LIYRQLLIERYLCSLLEMCDIGSSRTFNQQFARGLNAKGMCTLLLVHLRREKIVPLKRSCIEVCYIIEFRKTSVPFKSSERRWLFIKDAKNVC